MITINGKSYPLWSQFVERKGEWIGGTLEDFGDSMDRRLGAKPAATEITDITLKANGDSAFFSVDGEDFGCGFDVQYGGVSCSPQEPGWVGFSGYMGHSWRIKQREKP